VSAEVLERPSAARYPTAPGVSYSGSAPSRDNPNPEYPAGLLARLLPPVTVMVRVVVGGDGAVSSASIIEPASEDAAFGDATLAAVRAWTFDPLRRVTVTDGKSEALPFTREFRFTFRQVNGHAVVDNVQ
jgi:TonB family protein